MAKKNFQLAIMHGHSKDYLQLKEIVLECNFTPRIMIEEYAADTIFGNLRDLVWDEIHCVLVLMTRDDDMLDGSKRARQNVIFELGYCFWAFDSLPEKVRYTPKDAIIIVAEENLELFSDIHGLTRIDYASGELDKQKAFISQALKKSYRKAKDYYKL